MSAEGVRSLFERVQQDESLRRQVQAAATPEEKARVAVDAGFDVTADELVPPPQGELTDEDLEQVAGGGGWQWIYTDGQWTPTQTGGTLPPGG